jgi:hypothetical protein
LPVGVGFSGAQTAPRYEAVFSDGSRLEGKQLTGWSKGAYSPRLDGTSLDDPKRPLRWLKDRRLKPWRKPSWCDGYIEFVGGDRIIGRVVGSRPSRNAGGVHFPAHLLVAPARDPKTPARIKPPKPIRVLIDTVKRIVMTSNPRGDYRPGRLVRKGGRDVDFVSLRLREDSLHVLLSNTAITVKFDDIVEICFPQVDPWEAYFRMLGVLSPACRLRLVRLETIDGLIATASALRIEEQAYAADSYKHRALHHLKRLDADLARLEPELEKYEKTLASVRDEYAKLSAQLEKSPAPDSSKRLAGMKSKVAGALQKRDNTRRHIAYVKLQRNRARGIGGSSDSWSHVIQPIWCLDAMRIPFNRIHMRWSLAPDRLPLSMIHPTASVNPPFQSWRAGRTSGGGSFHSAGREYCWGFAVHAYSELSFTLPKCANSFQARLGLDSVVGSGGCVRARVFLGSTEGKPLYESPMLIGSKKTVDSGAIAIRPTPKGSRRLTLQADTAHKGRPPGADPLNIRDRFNWLEPVIGLDASGLQDAVLRETVKQLRPWKGWTVKFDKRGRYAWTGHLWKDKDSIGRMRFRPMVRAEKHPLVFSRQITIRPRDNWLTVDTGVFGDDGAYLPRAVSLRVGEKVIKPEKSPGRQSWQMRAAPPLFSIGQHRGKKVTLELTQKPDAADLYWHRIEISNDPPGEYCLAGVLKKSGGNISRALGWALQSDALSDSKRLAVLDIHRLGGVVNFQNSTIHNVRVNRLGNILIGNEWTGGDKAFMMLAKMRSLKSLLLAGDAGVSPATIEKLKTLRPDLKIKKYEHTPSGIGGPCPHFARNNCDKAVTVYWSNYQGNIVQARTIAPNGKIKIGGRSGRRYKAYIDGKLIATYRVMPKPGVVWEIND